MQQSYRLARLVVAPALLAGLAAGCADKPALTAPTEVAGARVRVASVTVSPARDTLAIGGTAQLRATVRDRYGNVVQRTVTWLSSNPGIVGVSDAGLIVGRALGTATITARDASGVSGTATVLVANGTTPPPPPPDTVTPPPTDTVTPPPPPPPRRRRRAPRLAPAGSSATTSTPIASRATTSTTPPPAASRARPRSGATGASACARASRRGRWRPAT